MTKNNNPFDSITADSTPVEIFKSAIAALAWLEPHLKNDDVNHTFFVTTLKAYAMMLYGDSENPDDEGKAEDWSLLRMKQRQIVSTFDRIRREIISAQALAQVRTSSKAQSARASKSRSPLDDAQMQSIAREYWATYDGRAAYGVVKDLAGRYEVSEATIRKIANDRNRN